MRVVRPQINPRLSAAEPWLPGQEIVGGWRGFRHRRSKTFTMKGNDTGDFCVIQLTVLISILLPPRAVSSF